MDFNLSSMLPSPELVLLCIREGWATTPDSLCEIFGFSPVDYHTGHSLLVDALSELESANLISISNAKEHFRSWAIGFDIQYLTRIQTALGVSLKALAANDRNKRMVVTPLYGRTRRGQLEHDIFVVMPFSKELEPVYHDHIKAVANRLSLSCARADDFFSVHNIMDDIWIGICNAEFIIADCTDKNANVFYELGLAHSIGKPVILISRRADDVPFDIKAIRYILYDFTPRGMREFETKLESTISQLRGDPEAMLRHLLYRRT
jgi:hypothetical protein